MGLLPQPFTYDIQDDVIKLVGGTTEEGDHVANDLVFKIKIDKRLQK